jgi:peptide subunit release factor 1 (eRF1)
MRVLGEMDLIDFFEEKNKDYGSNLTVVTRETREGEQFFQLGGVGAFLRYRA